MNADHPMTFSAASDWMEGEPDEKGDYLVEYGLFGQISVCVAHYDDGWYLPIQTTVKRYARINSPHIG